MQPNSTSDRYPAGLGYSAFPERWRVFPLRHLIGQIQSGVSVNASDNQAAEDEVAVLKTSSVYTGDFDISETKTVVEDELNRVACPVAADRLIVSRMNTPALVGMAGYSAIDHPNVFLPDRLWQVSFLGVDARFIHRWTQTSAYRDQVSVVTAGTSSSMHNLSQDDFKSFVLAIPPADEQAAILRFLDRETAKIDLLIEKQERLVETLAERRQAVIGHAVTKGLDPNAPMKKSKVAWLGELPSAWRLIQVKLVFEVTLGKMLDAGRSAKPGDEQLPYIRAGNIQERGLDMSDIKTMAFTPTEQVALSLKMDDLLVVEGGAVGVCVVLHEDMPGWSFQKTVNRVRARDGNSTAFLSYYLDSIRSAGVVDMLCNKSTIAHFTAEKLKAVEMPLPSIEDQHAIVRHLDGETAQIDALSAKAREMIEVLKERRQALISAAVTGKIDLRGLS